MKNLNWKNIDWDALRHSQVIIGSGVGILCSALALTGHVVDSGTQQQIVSAISDVAIGLAGLGSLVSFWKRLVAQPEHQTVIVPKKEPQDNPNSEGKTS